MTAPCFASYTSLFPNISGAMLCCSVATDDFDPSDPGLWFGGMFRSSTHVNPSSADYRLVDPNIQIHPTLGTRHGISLALPRAVPFSRAVPHRLGGTNATEDDMMAHFCAWLPSNLEMEHLRSVLDVTGRSPRFSLGSPAAMRMALPHSVASGTPRSPIWGPNHDVSPQIVEFAEDRRAVANPTNITYGPRDLSPSQKHARQQHLALISCVASGRMTFAEAARIAFTTVVANCSSMKPMLTALGVPHTFVDIGRQSNVNGAIFAAINSRRPPGSAPTTVLRRVPQCFMSNLIKHPDFALLATLMCATVAAAPASGTAPKRVVIVYTSDIGFAMAAAVAQHLASPANPKFADFRSKASVSVVREAEDFAQDPAAAGSKRVLFLVTNIGDVMRWPPTVRDVHEIMLEPTIFRNHEESSAFITRVEARFVPAPPLVSFIAPDPIRKIVAMHGTDVVPLERPREFVAALAYVFEMDSGTTAACEQGRRELVRLVYFMRNDDRMDDGHAPPRRNDAIRRRADGALSVLDLPREIILKILNEHFAVPFERVLRNWHGLKPFWERRMERPDLKWENVREPPLALTRPPTLPHYRSM